MTLLRRLFLMMFLVIIIPTIILMSINYYQTKTFIEDEAKLSNHQIVKQAKVAMDSIISQTERISSQVAIDSGTQQLIFDEINTADYQNYQVLDDVYNMMLNFQKGTQYIDEIAIYKIDSDLLISTSETVSPAVIVKTKEYLEKLTLNAPMKLWVEPNASGVYWEQLSAFHFVRFIYSNGDDLAGFVVIKLKSNDFDRLINEMYIKDDGMLFIADQTGKLILTSQPAYRNIVDLKLNFDWFNQIENYKEVELDGQQYFLSLVTSDYNHWKYISIIDKAEIQSKLNIIRNNTIILLAFFFVASIILSFGMSKGIYNPIQLIKTSLEGGEEKKLRNNFLLGESEFMSINKEISSLLDDLKAQKIKQHDYEDRLDILQQKHSMTDRKLHKYNFYRLLKGEEVDEKDLIQQPINYDNTASTYRMVIIELLNSHQGHETIEVLRSTIEEGVISTYGQENIVEYFFESDSRMVLLLKGYADKLVEDKVKQHLVLESIHLMVYSDSITFDEIRKSYEHLLKVLKYCLITAQTGIVYDGDFEYNESIKRLPYDYQTYLNNSLRASSLEECKTIIIELERVIKSDFYFASNYSFYYRDVLNTIIGFLYEIQYIKSNDMKEITESFSDFEKRFKSINDATDWTLKFITNVFGFVKEAPNADKNSMISQCIRIIEDEYMKDISLNEVADRLFISVPYLSKQFKEVTGINFKDYVTSYKIEKAKQLLLSTKSTVSEVALQVGYNSSLQLVRMFKKLENITPTEYRKRN